MDSIVSAVVPLEARTESYSTVMELRGYGLHDDIDDEGCWIHSYCRYCTSDFCRYNLTTYLDLQYTSAGRGITVDAFRSALDNINETCIAFGYNVYGVDDW